MCAIYTAIPPPSPEEKVVLAKRNESEQWVKHRKTIGRRAMLELVSLVSPPARKDLAKTIFERDLWGFLTPAASRGNHGAALAKTHEDIAVPFPLWPESTLFACLCGAEPAEYLGNNLAMLPPDLVSLAIPMFEKFEGYEVVYVLNEFLRSAEQREDAVLLHWDHR